MIQRDSIRIIQSESKVSNDTNSREKHPATYPNDNSLQFRKTKYIKKLKRSVRRWWDIKRIYVTL